MIEKQFDRSRITDLALREGLYDRLKKSELMYHKNLSAPLTENFE